MKAILFFLAIGFPIAVSAQFVVGSQGMTVQAGATLTVDSLVMHPLTDFTITSNAIARTSTVVTGYGGGSSIARVYSFANPVTYNGPIGFFYKDAELAGNTESGLQIAYSSTNPSTIWITTTGSVVNTSTNFISSTFSNTPLTKISATSSVTPLPVSLMDFTAEKNDAQHSVLLSWEVVNEQDISSYEIERSQDARDFSGIGTTTPARKSSYHFTDQSPENGSNYYRLKILEADGAVSYSAIRMVSFGVTAPVLSVYPNPVATEVVIHSKDTKLEGMEGMVVNAAGVTTVRFKLSGSTTRLDASSWMPGNYFIRLSNGSSFKVIKK